VAAPAPPCRGTTARLPAVARDACAIITVVKSSERAPSAEPTAYVLGGNAAGLAVVRSLGRAGVPVVTVLTDDRDFAARSRYATVLRAPDPADAARAFVDLLRRQPPGVLVPATDASLEALAEYHDMLAERHIVACPAPEVAQLFLDKLRTSEVAERAGVAAPRTVVPATAEELDALAGELTYPCLVKPRESFRYSRAFGVKMHRVEDAAQLRTAWRRADDHGIGTVVQELIPGPEVGGVNYNVYVVDGAPVVELTSRKVRLSPRDFGFPTVVQSAPVPEVVEPGRRIVAAMGIEGFANVEFKRDARDGSYKLMEVNGRPNMSGALAVRCGVDFPLLAYRHLVDGVVPTSQPWQQHVYWVDEVADARSAVRRWRGGELSLRDALTPYVGRHVFVSFATHDPGPLLGRVGTAVANRARRLAFATPHTKVGRSATAPGRPRAGDGG
jgi:predicted ATP-grasp superfamily ATP-dependent carboligase